MRASGENQARTAVLSFPATAVATAMTAGGVAIARESTTCVVATGTSGEDGWEDGWEDDWEDGPHEELTTARATHTTLETRHTVDRVWR